MKIDNLSKINRVNGRILSAHEMIRISGGGYPTCDDTTEATRCSGPCTNYFENPDGTTGRFHGTCLVGDNNEAFSCRCVSEDDR